MPITHISSTGNALSGTTVPVTVAPTTVGNLLVVGAGVSGSSHTLSVSDNKGNVWVQCNAPFVDSTNNNMMRSWYAFANTTNITTISITNSSSSFVSATCDEFSGVDSAAPLDQVATSLTGQSGTPVTQSFTPQFGDELVWAYTLDTVTAVGNIGGSAASQGGDDLSQDWSEYRILSGGAGTSITAAFTGSGAYDVIAATFKPVQPPSLSYGSDSVPVQQRF